MSIIGYLMKNSFKTFLAKLGANVMSIKCTWNANALVICLWELRIEMQGASNGGVVGGVVKERRNIKIFNNFNRGS